MSAQEAAEFEALATQLRQDIQPDTTLENIIFKELARASWRLELCARTEDGAANDATADSTQTALDRARTTALNIILKTTAELRRLQTNRRIGIEIYPDDADISHHGIATQKEIIAALANNERRLTIKDRLEDGDHLDELMHQANKTTCEEYRKRNPPQLAAQPGPVAVPPPPADSSFCKTAETPANTAIPRRSPCPCKSGDRYKNCCGKNAPPVLHHGVEPNGVMPKAA